MLWSMIMIVFPASFSRFSIEKILLTAFVSSSAVASSRIRTSVSRARVAASAAFCFCPPERVCGARVFRWLISHNSITSSSLFINSFLEYPRFSSPERISSSTLVKINCDSASSKTIPICRLSSFMPLKLFTFRFLKMISPSVLPPISWCRMPAIARASVVFPAALCPVTRSSSPCWTSRLILFRTGVSAVL